MVTVIPAILSNDPQEVVELLEKADGVVKRVQIDILDGVFANNKTIEPSFLENYEFDLDIDYHLMTKEPSDWVERAVRGQGERVIGQIEQMTDQIGFIGKVQEVGLSVGLALDLETEVSRLENEALSSLDVVLIMSVPAGFPGQTFDLRIFPKIKELVNLKGEKGYHFKICVDGGVTRELIKDLESAGVEEIVVGKRLFEGDLKENIEELLR